MIVPTAVIFLVVEEGGVLGGGGVEMGERLLDGRPMGLERVTAQGRRYPESWM